MEKIYLYRANDGTDFEDEVECLDYEFHSLVKDFSYSIFNRKMEKLDNLNPESYELCWYAYLPNEKSAGELEEAMLHEAVNCYSPDVIKDNPNITGILFYDERIEDFIHVGNEIAYLLGIEEKIKSKLG